MLVCNSESRIVAGSKSIANVWIYASFVQMCVLKPKIARPKRSFILYKFALASGNGLCTKERQHNQLL